MTVLYAAYPRFSTRSAPTGAAAPPIVVGRYAMRKLVFLASFAGLSLAGPASATLITFDNLPINPSFQRIPNPYDGFDWSPHFMYLNGADYLYPSGYQNGVVSKKNVAFNGGGSNGEPPPPVNFSRRAPFELDSFYLAAAWRNGLEVTVTGELCSSAQTCVVDDSTTLTVSTSGPTLETFNWDDVNKVVFQSVLGSGIPVGFEGYQFVLDNVRVSSVPELSTRFNAFDAVPELSTWTLVLVGFAGLGCAGIGQRARRIGFAVTPFGVPCPPAAEYPSQGISRKY